MVSKHSLPSAPAPPEQPPPDPSPPATSGSRGERIFTISILALFGIAFGLGLFTFSYAKGFSYLSNDPAACVNCHIMRDQYEGWSHSSHKAVATCNDCHTPHRFPDKWVIKGVNGWNHSVAFTTGNFPEPIMIRGFNARIAQENCVECHATTVAQMHLYASTEELRCVACHGNVGHDNAAPNANFAAAMPAVTRPAPATESGTESSTESGARPLIPPTEDAAVEDAPVTPEPETPEPEEEE